ncbi:hypothetical protein SLE2022_209380 [Rubroshorea leprosula]
MEGENNCTNADGGKFWPRYDRERRCARIGFLQTRKKENTRMSIAHAAICFHLVYLILHQRKGSEHD